ncbi:putative phage abortive infection protein [Neisseria flavescens]|uniref:putative phage abortive infection protein n=1 Tax=Neisseria flavescens TaxID=484 RepID=UPI001787435E|nr:putative phage abortive infection protein [Neisseria flavescens]
MSKENIPQTKKLICILLVFALLAFFFVLGVYIYYFNALSIIKDTATWGTFGDYFGGTLNPIISLLALIGLLYTIHQQAQEMKATREELKQASEQQRKQVEQQSRQSEIFNLQQFESTFFSLLEQHNNILEKIIVNNNKIKITMISSLNEKYEKCSILYKKYKEIYELEESHLMVSNQYIRNNIRQDPELRRYFIILFQLLKLISISLSTNREAITECFSKNDEESRKGISKLFIDPKEKIYSNILRSFIPNEILKLLALNCLTLDNSSDMQNLKTFFNFQGLLNRYAFLEHLQLGASNDVRPLENHSDFIWLFLVKTIGIDDLEMAFSKNYTSTAIIDLFNRYKKEFISILEKESDWINITKGNKYSNINKEDLEPILRELVKMKRFLELKDVNN